MIGDILQKAFIYNALYMISKKIGFSLITILEKKLRSLIQKKVP